MKLRYHSSSLLSAVLLALAVMVGSSPAAADEAANNQVRPGGVDAQTFRPAAGPGGLITVEGTETAGHLGAYAGMYVDVLRAPLVLSFDDGTTESVIDRRVTSNLVAGVGLFERFEFELGMPVVLDDQGEYLGEPIAGGGPGDLRAAAKATLLSSRDGVVGLGAVVDATVPTGQTESFRGSPSPTVSPHVVADTRVQTPAGELVVATNAGARLRSSQTVHNLQLGPQFTYAAGMQLEIFPQRFSIGADLYGAVDLTEVRRETTPMELLVGVELRAVDGLSVTAAGGAGLVSGVGSPEWRALVGMSYSPTKEHAHDDIRHHTAVECPPEPEGFEGPYDDDGCPVTPETFTGCDGLDDDWEGAVDEWGCPLLDSDGDGFLVWEDDCPFEPVEFIGVDDDDGCPNYDIDGDGVVNVFDHCPYEPGLRVYDGCPPAEDEEKAERVRDEEIEITERVHFETNKAVIMEESYALLEEVAMIIRENSDVLLVEVAGHTDERGDADYNMMLSEERAKAVREFLIKRGNVNPDRLDARGYGETRPISDKDSERAHAENRRVEFRIVETERSEESNERTEEQDPRM